MRSLPVPAAILALWVAGVARAQPPEVPVAAIPEFTTVVPGAAMRIALRLSIPDGYHLSWTNPGRTGLATTIAWQTPSGFQVDGTEWPYPELDETAGLPSHVYRGETVVVTRFVVAPSAREGPAVLRAALSWGICGRRCYPQSDTVDVRLRVHARASEPTAAWWAVAPHLDLFPFASPALTMQGVADGSDVHLTITAAALEPELADSATFFPAEEGVAVVVPVEPISGGFAVTLPDSFLAGGPGRLHGILVADRPWLVGSRRRALAVDAAVTGTP